MRERDRRRIDALRADQAAVRAAAAWVREQGGGRIAVLDDPDVAELLGELLDGWAAHLEHLDGVTRDHVVRVCRELVGDRMDQPTRRRTRRRG